MVNMKRNTGNRFPSAHSLILTISGIVSLLGALLLYAFTGILTGAQQSQTVAQRWSADGGVAQVSCFFSVNASVTADSIEAFRHGLMAALQEASIESESPNASARLWADAYSADGKITVKSSRASVTADAIGIGGDFFLFHPLKLLTGAYFSESDLNQDYCILDETAAWQLFGSNDVAGQIVFIGETPHMVSGVIKREEGRMAEAAGLDGTLIYVSYSTLKNLGINNGINHYEIVMPDPVSGYAYQYVSENIGVAEKEMDVIENTGRFDLLNRFRILAAFGERSMNGKAIRYPYWENMARGYEDIIALLTFLALLLAGYPVILVIVLLRILWKNRTWSFADICKACRDKIEDLMRDLRSRRKSRKEKKEDYDD